MKNRLVLIIAYFIIFSTSNAVSGFETTVICGMALILGYVSSPNDEGREHDSKEA